MSEKTKVLGVRLETSVYDRLQSFENATDVEKVTLARAAIIACLNYFDEHGSLAFPLQITPVDSTPRPTSKKRGAKPD